MTGSTGCRAPGAVMVTGAGSGIGQAITHALLDVGTTVFGGAVDDVEADRIAAYRPGNGSVHPIRIDVRDDTSVTAAAEAVADHLGDRPLDGLLNVAGISTNGPLVDLAPETFRNVLAVNLVGMHATTRAFLPLLRRKPKARVINMSSASGRRTLPFTGAYAASKYGVEALSTAMRLEFAPLGVRVSVIAPGLINTPMAANIEHDLLAAPSERIYAKPLASFLKTMKKSTEGGVAIDTVVSAALDALTRENPKARYEIHNNFVRDVIALRLLPEPLRDRVLLRALDLRGMR